MFRTIKGSIVNQTTLTSDNRTCLERRNALKPTRNKPSGLLAVVLGLTTAVASVGLLSETMSAFAQNYPQPNAQVPVANQPMAQNAVPVMQQAAPVTNTPEILRENSRRLLVAARTSLAGGDVVTAEQQYQQAVALNAPYTAQDDRPEYVKPLIDRHTNWLVAQKTYGNTEQVRRMRAENLTLQAEGFYFHRNLDMAEKLVAEAIAQNVGASMEMVNLKRDPQSLARRINDERILQAERNGTLVRSNSSPIVSPAVQQQAREMQPVLAQARQFLQAGRVADADSLCQQLVGKNVPESAFEANSDTPARLLADIARTRQQMVGQTMPGIQQTVYNPMTVASNHTVQVQGMMDPTTVPGQMPTTAPERNPMSNPADVSRQASEYEFAAEVQRQITRSQQMMSEQLPKMNDAIANLQDMRTKIETADISPEMKRNLTIRVDRELMQMEDYRTTHGAAIQMAQDNANVYAELEEQHKQNAYVEMKLKEFSDEYYKLCQQERYAEAEVVAEKARTIAPGHPFVEQMAFHSMMASRVQQTNALKDEKEKAIYTVFTDQLRASTPNVSDNKLLALPTSDIWNRVATRTGIASVGEELSATEQVIYHTLEQPITFTTGGKKPLRAVVDELSRQMQINIMVDTQAMADGNIGLDGGSDIDVELDAKYEIKLKNALSIMLRQVGLTYTVRNEALYITTPNRVKPDLKYKAYYVGDLVKQYENAPRIRPKSGMARHKEAMDIALGRHTGFSVANQMPVQAPVFQPVSMNNSLNNQSGMNRLPSHINPQTFDSNYRPGGYSGNFSGYNDYGYGYDPVGAAGGGANFGDLVSLIMEVVAPDSWRGGGAMGGQRGGTIGGTDSTTDTTTTDEGEATIREFYNTLTLIIRQTEDNHQQIADLLKQLRKMNDIQINVEVRFITIRDDFFESIGMDFDFGVRNSQENKYAYLNAGATDGENTVAFTKAVKHGNLIAGLRGSSATTDPPNFSSDLGISVNQNSYGLSVPTFGGYDPSAGASMGFAILSNIETYFFMSAAQGDSRSNVLQAPKVTLINGQYAMVNDTTDRPFVSSLVPVVGDFAVAMQPVVEIQSEGVMLGVDGVVSSDRRYVRMNLSPMFNTISDTVPTFDFGGGSTTTGTGGTTTTSGNGGVVQQPITTTFSVMTSVSVPDGGTILLGGVKRLSEGRKEYGVPMVNKIPYLKRLFSNTAVGRETQSMMLMVTPHIIIQEEYEESMNTASEYH